MPVAVPGFASQADSAEELFGTSVKSLYDWTVRLRWEERRRTRVATAPQQSRLKSRSTTNQRMAEILIDDPGALMWSTRQWATHLRCAAATVHSTAAYSQCKEAQENAKMEKQARELERKRDGSLR